MKADWISNRSSQETLEILGHLVEVCADLGGPLSRQLADLVKAGDFSALVNYDVDYSRATLGDVRDYQMARQILGFYQKSEWLPLGINKRAVAIDRFFKSEMMCKETNERFRFSAKRPIIRSSVSPVIDMAVRKIAQIVNGFEHVDFNASFGPGANTSVKGQLANPRVKLGAALACSSNTTKNLAGFLMEVPHWSALHASAIGEESMTVEVRVDPGTLMFVPKNAKTDRSIVIEPILNSFFQKGIGDFLRERLLRFGVNLRDQDRNQKLAALGSSQGTVATLDLSMASDCLSKNLVAELLPYDFYELLNQLRTPEVILKGLIDHNSMKKAFGLPAVVDAHIELEKFSSMGNGYTFELESMIFYALAFSVTRHLKLNTQMVSVYGDDIIVPVEAVPLLTEVLSHCGFVLNKDKSFSEGPFRESCGADYLFGFDIRPYYQKSQVSDRTLYTMHNWFIRHGEYELARAVVTFTNPALRLYGPDGYGDGHLIGSHSLRRNRKILRLGYCGGFFDTYALRVKRFTKPLPGDALLPVYSVYTRSGADSPTDPDVVRGSSGYAKVSIYTLSENIFNR